MRTYFLGFLMLLVCASASAFETTTRSAPLGKDGSLQVQAPTAWKDSLEPPRDNLPAALKLTPKTGAAFEIYIAPFTPDVANGRGATMDELRRIAREAANSVSYRAVERPIELKEIHDANPGYYFSVTDKEPKPNEFKYMTQGVLAVGQLRVVFIILTNDGQQSIVKEALAMVTTAVHR